MFINVIYLIYLKQAKNKRKKSVNQERKINQFFRP